MADRGLPATTALAEARWHFDVQQAGPGRPWTWALINRRGDLVMRSQETYPTWGSAQLAADYEANLIAAALASRASSPERDEAVDIVLWLAAIDRVPIEDRIGWVAAMRERYEGIRIVRLHGSREREADRAR